MIVAPIAFVSEHSETLVELDIEYRHLADSLDVPDYLRVPTVGTQPQFIAGLADLVMQAMQLRGTISECGARLCLAGFQRCAFGEDG